MDVDAIVNAITSFARRNSVILSEIPRRQSALLELAAITGVQEHYRSNGFTVNVVNRRSPRVFRIKTSTRGDPWDYSHIVLKNAALEAELHMNLAVTGAHDAGRYCVDVAIVKPGAVPARRPRRSWTSLSNSDLLSFAEVKRLVVYPMLLAQFLGIVHEIKPKFMGPRKVSRFDRSRHLPPTLIALGHYSGNARAIVTSYASRKLRIHIAAGYDLRVAAKRKGTTRSPLYWDDEE